MLGGHWVPRPMIENLDKDCARRMRRIRQNLRKRVLISVGGAGGQAEFVAEMIRLMERDGLLEHWQLILNSGDRPATQAKCLAAMKGLEFERIESVERLDELSESLAKGEELDRHVVLTLDAEGAIYATDTLCRGADVLCTKPSELAFYPVPKLCIRRIGNHEAKSAMRAEELGDGSHELRTPEKACRHIFAMEKNPELLLLMNECIWQHSQSGVYDGCKTIAHVYFKSPEKYSSREAHRATFRRVSQFW
jgi:hypothetical protein